ncbi:unnamed protein product [Prunus brigantina]
MKDLDLLHRENMPPRPILEINLGLARDVFNLHNRYEDLKPSFKASDFCKATHEANLANYAKQKAELDQMVAGYKEAKTAADKLERQIEELHKQQAGLREKQNKLRARMGTKTKATFLCRTWLQLLGQHWRLQRPFSIKGCFSSKKFLPRRLDYKKLLGTRALILVF